MNLNNLYQRVILDHNKNPRNFGELSGDCLSAERNNPVCGDQVKLMAQINARGELEIVRFTAKGCAISIASASMLTEILLHKTIEQAKEIAGHIFDIFQEKIPAGQLDRYGDFSALKGVLEYPVRIKCVLLCWQAFLDMVNQH